MRAHERVHLQNARDFPPTKLDGKIHSPFLLNEYGDPRIFFQVIAKNSLIKNIFEEEKKFDSGPQCKDIKLTTELSVKVQYSRNQAIKNSLNEAIQLMSINEALLSR